MQYPNAVLGAETEIQLLQLTATQMQWSINVQLEAQSQFAACLLPAKPKRIYTLLGTVKISHALKCHEKQTKHMHLYKVTTESLDYFEKTYISGDIWK